MMKASATILLAIVLFAGTAEAQRTRADYSREAVQRFVMSTQIEEDEIRHEYDPLVTNFAAFGTTFRLGYLPQLMMPMAGSVIGTTQTWPDAFSLTGTQIATSPRAWRTQRAFRRELREINRRLNADVRVETR